MVAANPLDLLMLGHFARDIVAVDGRAEWFNGGGVYFGSVAARRLGAEVGIVTRLHRDDFPRLAELESLGIRVFAADAGATSGIENRYNSADMERRECKLINFAGPIRAADLPDVPAKIYAITPIIAGEVDLPLLKLLARRGPVALDIQGFVRVPQGRNLVFQPWADMEEGLRHVTWLKVDRAEAEMLTGLTDLQAAARRLAQFGPREIVLTQSSGVTVFAGGKFYHGPFTPRSLAGRTGRGDTCFATYLTRRLTHSPEEAAQWAGAVTTLKQEVPGPWRGPVSAAQALLQSLWSAWSL